MLAYILPVLVTSIIGQLEYVIFIYPQTTSVVLITIN